MRSTSRPARVRGADLVLVRVAVVFALVLTALIVLVTLRVGPVVRLDGTISRDTLRVDRADPAVLSFFRGATQVGNPLLVDVYCAIAIAYLVLRRRWLPAAAVALARLISLAAAYILKIAVDRPRPHPRHPVAHAAGSSFPSGHSTGIATVVALALIALWLTRATRSGARLAVVRGVLAAVLVLIAFMVAASRLFLDVHFLSDVVAGLSLGAVSACVAVVAIDVGMRRGVRR